MAMMSSEWKPPPMAPSQDEAHTMLGDVTEIAVSNSDNDIHFVQVRSARLDGQMPDNPENRDMEDGITFDVPSFSFLLATSLDLGPVQMASAWVFTMSGDWSREGGVSPCAGSTEWLQYGTDRLSN
jgi:hypothetical protein